MPDAADQHGLFYEGGERIDGIKGYLLSIFAAAIICAIVTRLMGDKGTHGTMAKLIAGLFLTFTVIRPVADVKIDLSGLTPDFSIAADQAAAAGESMTREAMAKVIKSKTEAYILDKAVALNAELKVEVTLSKDDIPIPSAVRLSGKISPYAKAQLQAIITQDLGIEKERQLWT
ncbi:MAG: hypothetical protein IJW14_01925 [Oscillospiraceae bacterium]|nr:hypothetical protein [Oscillospiraceae bacterium]